MEKLFTEIADMIFERGACKFGAFKLKLHEKFPDAPLSPIYMNLRTAENPTNPGPLTDDDCYLIAKGLKQVIERNRIAGDAIASIPYAADPIVRAYRRLMLDTACKACRVVKLAKELTEKGRRIVPMPGFVYEPGEGVILFDDLVTKADSKIEAIKAIESSGLIVNNLVVLMDREQGGREELEKAGYDLYAYCTISELLAYYCESKRISSEKYAECIEYLRNNR